MSPVRRASSVPGLRAAVQGAPPAPAPHPASERPETRPPAAGPRPRPRPPKPVRVTLDLAADDHRALRRFALDAGVTASAVMRALLAELRSDPELADRVRSATWPQ